MIGNFSFVSIKIGGDVLSDENYYNVKEALDYIRQYPSGREATKYYMNLSEKQIRDILKKDVLGKYKGIPVGKRARIKYENYDGDTAFESVYVFPKYGDNPKILSSWDSIYKKESDIVKKLQREGYKTEDEKIRENFKSSGKPSYLMNEDYLFSLKLEVERRQLPIKFIDIPLHTVAIIKGQITEYDLTKNFTNVLTHLLTEFNEEVQEDIASYNQVCNEKFTVLMELLSDVKGRRGILASVAPYILTDDYQARFDKMVEYSQALKNNPVSHTIDIKKQVNTLEESYMGNPSENFADLASKIYDFEKYQLNLYKSKVIEHRKEYIELVKSYQSYLISVYGQITDDYWKEIFLKNLEDNFGIKINR